MQDITNSAIDIHDLTGQSIVKSYSSAVISSANFISLQDIHYTQYDKFGNVLTENIKTYTDEAATVLQDYKEIVNHYKDDVTAKRGNADISTVSRWTSADHLDSQYIDKTVTTTTLFDLQGRAVDQVQETSVYNGTTLELASHNEIVNINYDNRGDAAEQHITSYKVIDGAFDSTSVLVDYKVMTNRTYDASHNIVNQMVCTYSDPQSDMSAPLDVEEIRSIGITPSGMALKEIIVTYPTPPSRYDFLGIVGHVLSSPPIRPHCPKDQE